MIHLVVGAGAAKYAALEVLLTLHPAALWLVNADAAIDVAHLPRWVKALPSDVLLLTDRSETIALVVDDGRPMQIVRVNAHPNASLRLTLDVYDRQNGRFLLDQVGVDLRRGGSSMCLLPELGHYLTNPTAPRPCP